MKAFFEGFWEQFWVWQMWGLYWEQILGGCFGGKFETDLELISKG
jgi:hypothetical protein